MKSSNSSTEYEKRKGGGGKSGDWKTIKGNNGTKGADSKKSGLEIHKDLNKGGKKNHTGDLHKHQHKHHNGTKTDAKKGGWVKDGNTWKKVADKDTKDVKDAKHNHKDHKDNKNSKDAKDSKNTKDIKNVKDAKDIKNSKDVKDAKNTKDIKNAKDAKDANKNTKVVITP